MWLLEELVPGSGVNNVPLAFRVDGALEPWALRQSVQLLLHRYEALRTVFRVVEGGGLVKEVLAPGAVDVPLHEAAPEPDDLPGALKGFVAAPFGFTGGALVRAGHFRADDHEVFCVVVHHVIFDAASAPIVLKDFVAVYDAVIAGQDSAAGALPEVPAFAEPPASAESRTFWRQQLAGLDPLTLELRIGEQDPPEADLVGDRVGRVLGREVTAIVRDLAQELRTSEALVLLGVYFLLLSRHGAGPDISVGVPVNTRGAAARAVGYHVNIVAARLTVDRSQTFREFAGHVRDVFLDAVAHADLSVDSELLDDLRGGEVTWRSPVFRHVFNFVPGSDFPRFEIDYMSAEPVDVAEKHGRFDIELYVEPGPDSFELSITYATAVFDSADMAAFLARFEVAVRSLGAGAGAEQALRDVSTSTDVDAPAPDLRAEPATEGPLELVRKQVVASPDAVAVRDGADHVTYGQLWGRARNMSAALRAAGVPAGTVVAMPARRGADFAASLLGTWLAGCGCVPVPAAADLPELLAGTGATATVALAGATGLPTLDWAQGGEPPSADGGASAPTGPAFLAAEGPGWVVLDQDNLGAALQLLDLPADVGLWLTPCSSVLSLLELLLPLTTGGEVVVAPDSAGTDGRVLAAHIDRYGVTLVAATAYTWGRVSGGLGDALRERTVLCWGTPPAGLPDPARLVVQHGVPATTGVMGTAFVVDDEGIELPVGLRGTLCVAGAVVAAGTIGLPDLVGDHPVHGRFARTGLTGRRRYDGSLEVLGTADQVVAVRGSRVLLSSVEAALLAHPDVSAAAVVAGGDPVRLTAFADCPEETFAQLPAHLRARVAEAAVPDRIVRLERFPLSPAGTVDRTALAGIDDTPGDQPAGHDAVVLRLVDVWGAVLGRDDVDADANFFAFGGYSMLATELVSRIEEAVGVRPDLVDVFKRPTPARLAEVLVTAEPPCHPSRGNRGLLL